MRTMTAKELRLAADIMDAKGFKLTGASTDEEVTAAAFVFDNGLLMVGGPNAAEYRANVSKLLREKADVQEANGNV